MPTTMDLLQKALTVQSQARWADTLEISDATLSQAKKRGRLSPTLAGSIASALDENPSDWIALAALEAEPESTAKNRLLQRLNSVTKRYFCAAQRTISRAAAVVGRRRS